MAARPGGGGGDFAVSGSIDLRDAGHTEGETITLALTFAVS
jgi:hypothetical protein